MFEIIKDHLNLITNKIIIGIFIRFILILFLCLSLSFTVIFGTLSVGNISGDATNLKCIYISNGKNIDTEFSIEKLKDKNFNCIEKNIIEISWNDFLIFLGNNWGNIIFITLSFLVIYQIILPPTGYNEFLNRLYGHFIDIIKNDEELKDIIYISKNIAQHNGYGFIRIRIKGIPQNIHFGVYVMNFGSELKNEKSKKVRSLLKLGNKYEFLQLQIYFEDINSKVLGKVKTIEQKYFQRYNIIPQLWVQDKLKANLKTKNLNIGYIFESEITRKEILENIEIKNGKEIISYQEHEKLYEEGFSRKKIYNIIKNEILKNTAFNKDSKFSACYINFNDLSRNDVKIIAENYIQTVTYFLKNKEFVDKLKNIKF